MTAIQSVDRVAVLGMGAIGRRVMSTLRSELLPAARYAAFDRSVDARPADIAVFTDLDALLAWHPQLAVECAGHGVVAEHVVTLLRAGVDVVVVSVGALADAALRAKLEAAATEGGAELILVSGAIGGLDALSAAREAGLDSVHYIGRKPPAAWKGTPAERDFALDEIAEPTVIFEGTAAESARLYPKNANVTAAVALAGLGFEATAVRMIADPSVDSNVHEVQAAGAFGRFSIRLENNPLPDNPKTSWLAALSIDAALRHHLHPHRLTPKESS